MIRRARPCAIVAIAAVLASCAESTAPASRVAQLVIISGGSQELLYAGVLPEPLTVRAVDANGAPVPGVSVSWTPTTGTLSSPDVVTDVDGNASATWSIDGPGSHFTTVRVDGRRSAQFAATVFAGPVLVEWSYTPTTASLSGGPVAVNVTARVRTDYRGMNRVVVSFHHTVTADVVETALARLSGDAFDGVYTGRVVFQPDAALGSWAPQLLLATRLNPSCGCDGPPSVNVLSATLAASFSLPQYLTLVSE